MHHLTTGLCFVTIYSGLYSATEIWKTYVDSLLLFDNGLS